MSVPDFCPACGAYWSCEHVPYAAPDGMVEYHATDAGSLARALEHWERNRHDIRDDGDAERVWAQAIAHAGDRYAQGITR